MAKYFCNIFPNTLNHNTLKNSHNSSDPIFFRNSSMQKETYGIPQ